MVVLLWFEAWCSSLGSQCWTNETFLRDFQHSVKCKRTIFGRKKKMEEMGLGSCYVSWKSGAIRLPKLPLEFHFHASFGFCLSMLLSRKNDTREEILIFVLQTKPPPNCTKYFETKCKKYWRLFRTVEATQAFSAMRRLQSKHKKCRCYCPNWEKGHRTIFDKKATRQDVLVRAFLFKIFEAESLIKYVIAFCIIGVLQKRNLSKS